MTGGAAPPVARLDDIARGGGRYRGRRSGYVITGVSSLEDAAPGDIAYVESERFAEAARASRAGGLRRRLRRSTGSQCRR